MVKLTNAFTVDNIHDHAFEEHNGVIQCIYDIGRTDSDSGTVTIHLYDTGNEDCPKTYDCEVSANGDINWGLWATLSAIEVAITHFTDAYGDRYPITNNTSIERAA